ncbi:MAG: ASKHA domain-containing protein [Thermodesulfobacteriota bacterium]
MESLVHQGIFLRSDCGGKGKCGKCRVQKIIEGGRTEIIESCQYTVNEDVFIKIPESSMLSYHIMSKAPISFPSAFTNQFKHIDTKSSYGIAVDLGTTTIAVYLCDSARGQVKSSITVKNPQAIYGDDVMNRIGIIGQDRDNLGKLQKLVIKSIEWGVNKLLSSLTDKTICVSGMVVVGNPTMIHILAGVDPKSIGSSPYQPTFYEAKRFHSDHLGFAINDFHVQTLPNVSGFIGGDILAAAMAVDMEAQPEGTLLVDLGTNGELLLKNRKHFFATSCATGPAFEGATLSCGMPAVPGAINRVEIGDDKNLSTFSLVNPSRLNGVRPSGICGAGIINAVTQFCRKKIIKPDGAFREGKKRYILVPENSDTGQLPIYISQKDIRSVQLGKSALMTGIEFLLKKVGLKRPEKIIIAGAFGSHLSKPDLIQLGMIPEIDLDKIEVSGNAAGSGAVMALCDERYVEEAIETATKIEVVDLACNVDFQKVFIRSLGFPSE